MTGDRTAFAVGSQVFVDLWALMGFVPIPTESPDDISGVLSVLSREKAAFIVAEESWFSRIAEPVRKRLEKSGDLVWIQFPSCDSAEMR